MHNAAFKYLNLDYVYVPFQVKKEYLKEAVEGARALAIKGLNATIPHKTEVIKYLDVLDASVGRAHAKPVAAKPVARQIGGIIGPY